MSSASASPQSTVSEPGQHPGTLGNRFRAPGRPTAGVTSTRTPLILVAGVENLQIVAPTDVQFLETWCRGIVAVRRPDE